MEYRAGPVGKKEKERKECFQGMGKDGKRREGRPKRIGEKREMTSS